ncbi:MAG: DUF5679 domain-containing protein [Chloroflexota bacterium]
MAKRSRPTDPAVEAGTHPHDGAAVRKRQKRLRRELARLEVTEARRLEQLEEVRARMAALRARLATLMAADAATGPTPATDVPAAATGPTAASDAPTTGPTGYCMRERRRVPIDDPVPVTLSNGRAATAGTCSTCGARIVALTSRARPAGG